MAGFSKKNVEQVQRNGKPKESRTVVRYVTQMGQDGIDGADAYQVILSPNNHIFMADTDDQSDRVNVFVFRGTVPINAYIVESAIQGEIGKGSTNALTVTVHNNGTNQTYFDVNANSNLNVDSSTLIIPIKYNIDAYDSSTTYDASMWDESVYTIATFEAVYSWTMASSGQSAYVLDLSNENASINADASGNIIAGAMRPSCKATLTYGSADVSTGVYYSISYPSNYGVQGVSINSSTGVMTFNAGTASTPFRFGDVNDPNDTVLEITVDASFNGGKHREKVMTVTKSLPGQSGIPGDPGEDAVSRWIELSADAIRVDSSNNCIPPTITATPWKQVGGNDPSTDGSCNIRWIYDSSIISVNDPSTAYNGPITIQSTWNYLTFKLYYQNTYLGECETVPILRDGKNGQPGAQGRKGAAVRGPWLWDSSNNTNKTGLSPRRFCNGTDTLQDSDADWIDIIIHDGGYYRCTTSYSSTVNDTWTGTNGVSGKWTAADASYEFVAAQLLLANDAKIKFLSGNEIYLMNSSNQVTAGAAGGNGISFWAGAEQPSDAPFYVNYDGNLVAKSGTFAGYVQYPYTDILTLTKTTAIGDASCFIADYRANIVSIPDESYDSSVRYLKLPTPSEAYNGFTYTILIQPTMNTRGSGGSYLPAGVKIFAADNSDIWCYAYPQLMRSTKWYFECGYLVMTCIPTADGYVWAITQATGIMEYYSSSHEYSSGTHKDYYYTYHVSSVLGTSRDRDVSTGGAINPSLKTTVDMIYDIWTYTDGDAPNLNNSSVMYVKK